MLRNDWAAVRRWSSGGRSARCVWLVSTRSADDSRTRVVDIVDEQVRVALPRARETTIGSWRPHYDREVAEITKRQQFLAELAGEVLVILLGLWMVFGLGWREFGPGLVL